MNLSRLFPRAFMGAALLLASCGGGGGPTEMTISAQNAEAAAAAGVGAVSMVEGMSEMVDGMSDIFDPTAQVMPCDSGNVMLNVYDLGAAGLSTGDYASLDFNACRIDVGGGDFLTFNGGLYLRADDISGDPTSGPFTREFYGSFNALTATILGAVVVVDGGITASLSSPDDGTTLVLDVTCNDFSTFAQSGDAAFSGSLSNYHAVRTVNQSTLAYSVDFEGTIYATGLGSAHFETTVPFTGTGEDHPSAGTFVATGAIGATVTLIALDNINVQILVDADADGINETTINTTWAALENA